MLGIFFLTFRSSLLLSTFFLFVVVLCTAERKGANVKENSPSESTLHRTSITFNNENQREIRMKLDTGIGWRVLCRYWRGTPSHPSERNEKEGLFFWREVGKGGVTKEDQDDD